MNRLGIVPLLLLLAASALASDTRWLKSFAEAKAAAKRNGKPIFAFLHAKT